ncbi:MAG: Crp/Fnr family transcriptional regulator [Bryobacteraceae bacterium]
MARLVPSDYAALMAEAEIVSLKFRKKMLEQDAPVDAVYFPLTCMFSLLVTIDDQPQLELATIGKEGVIGAAEAMQKQGSMGYNLIQIPGSAVRIDAKAFRKLAATRPLMSALVFQHLLALLRQILYGAACNRLHSMEERCARWMLMTHDRAGEDTFPLTQEFLANMLGVRRATVNVATGMLKKAGFIRYVRGKITVTDRPGLESASCDCFQAMNRVYAPLTP